MYMSVRTVCENICQVYVLIMYTTFMLYKMYNVYHSIVHCIIVYIHVHVYIYIQYLYLRWGTRNPQTRILLRVEIATKTMLRSELKGTNEYLKKKAKPAKNAQSFLALDLSIYTYTCPCYTIVAIVCCVYICTK